MNRHSLRARDYLDHMLQAARRVGEYSSGKSLADFLAETLLQDAVIRNLEVLGEASRNLLAVFPDAPNRFPGIRFGAMYGTRNLLAHGYFFINLATVWEIVEKDIPPLREQLAIAIASWDANPPT